MVMGRPKKEFDDKGWAQIESMCGVQCTGEEIASVMGCSYDTLQLRIKETYSLSFSDYYKNHSGAGKASLRRSQYKMAHKNPTMAIWLGKQYLEQKDKQELDVSGNMTFEITPPPKPEEPDASTDN